VTARGGCFIGRPHIELLYVTLNIYG